MMVRLEATAAVYLAFAVPCGALLSILTRRPIMSAVAGSVWAMIVTSLLRNMLPFDYWAHAQDFIIEPFLQLKLLTHPLEASLSLLFQVGLPVLLIWGADRKLVTRYPSTSCQNCGYDLKGNVSGICSECGVKAASQKQGTLRQR